MNCHRKSPHPLTKTPAYRQVFQRLDEALEENTQSDNIEMMRRMRAEYLADVDRLEQSGTVVIPK